ncbi:hypothetical protein E2C01_028106 [Portunus trituberculatus]|uniref:Uncharacterized protein n=1 Tax=Portunus trituberculatus TaxID=210409 RepID=A0A5B7EN56_PORTR|nr:hypothetical protein [Portunus trituberculatus]
MTPKLKSRHFGIHIFSVHISTTVDPSQPEPAQGISEGYKATHLVTIALTSQTQKHRDHCTLRHGPVQTLSATPVSCEKKSKRVPDSV